MFVKEMRAKAYRGIDDLTINSFGQFNVLVGQNNSGKSTILSAIEAFYQATDCEALVNLSPLIGKKIDFHRHQSNKILIALTFVLDNTEWSAITSNLIREQPQVRVAAEALSKENNLYVEIEFCSAPETYSIIRRILLTSPANGVVTATLLEVSDEASIELVSRARQRSDHLNGSKFGKALIERFDGGRIAFSRPTARPDQLPEDLRISVRGVARRFPSLPKVGEEMNNLLARVTSTQDAILIINEFIDQKITAAAAIMDQPLRSMLTTFSGDIDRLPNFALKLIEELAQTRFLYLKERREAVGRAEASRLLKLKTNRGGPEILVSLQRTISTLLGVQVDAFSAPSSGNETDEDPAELDVDNFLIEVNGTGIREALRVVLDTEFKNPTLLLVEEPEVHLHPSLETSLMHYLRGQSDRRQIFITTHSTNFIDGGNSQSVFLVQNKESIRVTKLNIEDEFDQIAAQLGIRLSSLFMYDRIIFVEGPSDESVLREWAIKLDVNLGRRNIGFIHLGGSGNFHHYAAQTVLNFLTKRRVKIRMLLDRDERSDEELNFISNRIGADARIAHPRGRELENSLLLASANLSYLKERKDQLGENSFVIPSEADFHNQIEACADKLKQAALFRRLRPIACKPIYPASRKDLDIGEDADVQAILKTVTDKMMQDVIENTIKLDDRIEIIKEELNRNWPDHKLEIVPGSELLDAWYSEYGFRYDKIRDSARIAAHFSRKDIPQEIADFLIEACSGD